VQCAAEYVEEVCDRLNFDLQRVAIDTPRAPCGPGRARRAAEVAMDRAGISCFSTPTAAKFSTIRQKAKAHLAFGGAVSRIPFGNQLWMLVGFRLFEALERVAPCIETYPQAIVRVIGAAGRHKSVVGAVETQLAAAARYTGWPVGVNGKSALSEIAWGASHDRLDAYLSAWVASLEEERRSPFGEPPDDVIWVPKLEGSAPVAEVVPAPRARPPKKARAVPPPSVFTCPGCGAKEFKRWPWGWDAHAAYRCAGLAGENPEERKVEFRKRFAQYFPL